MENQPLLDDPGQGPLTRKGARTSLLPPRRQYMDMPFPEVFEEPGPGLLPEYLQILRRRKGTLILIVFLGLLSLCCSRFRRRQFTRLGDPSRSRTSMRIS